MPTLYPRSEPAKDADIPFRPQRTGEFSIGQLVEARVSVWSLLAGGAAAGRGLTSRPAAD